MTTTPTTQATDASLEQTAASITASQQSLLAAFMPIVEARDGKAPATEAAKAPAEAPEAPSTIGPASEFRATTPAAAAAAPVAPLQAAPALPHADLEEIPPIVGPAVYSGLSREAYDACKAWNASFLKKVLERTLGHAWYEFLRPDREEKEDENQFLEGNILHTTLLEPELYQARYVVMPDDLPKRPTEKQLQEPGPRAKPESHEAWRDAKAREEAWQAFEQSVPAGAQVIASKQHEQGQAWAGAVLGHPILGPRFAPEHRPLNELTLVCLDPITKAPLKGRIDNLRVLPDRIWIGDLKTARAGGEQFGRDAGKFGYVVSATFYANLVFFCRAQIEQLLGLAPGALIGLPVEFEFIIIEKTAPYFVERRLLTSEQAELGQKLIRRALDATVAADAANWWPAYSEEAQPLELPGYWWKQMQDLVVAMEASRR